MQIDLFPVSTESLLKELCNRIVFDKAPCKTTYCDGMQTGVIGIGVDEVATITVPTEGLKYLEVQ